jgi:hypothetical protein
MAFAPQAILGSLTLPVQFSYQPYVPSKRNSITPTAGAVIVQSAPDQIIHGDGVLPFTIEAMYPTEWNSLYGLYDTALPTLYSFKGYWGEVLDVYFTTLDQPSVRSRLFDVSGQLQVIDMTSSYTAACTASAIA